MQVTLEISEVVYRYAERLARLTGREVNSILNDILASPLRSTDAAIPTLKSLDALSDEEVLKLANLQMEPTQDQRLSELLYLQQARDMSQNERSELQELMQIYQEGLLHKAQAQREAVLRGLIKR
jgi:pyruvate-formate lyase